MGNRTSLTYPNLTVGKYTYDKLNRMTQAVDGLGAKTTYGYNADSQLTGLKLGNGATSGYEYDAAGRQTVVVNKAGGTTISEFVYTLDPVGNKLKAKAGTAVTNYAYDALNRLISSTPPGGNPTTYTYDAAANRLAVDAPAGTTHFTYDAANRMLTWGAEALSFDHNGNLLNDGTFTYAYDALNRLISVTGGGVNAQYKYDAFARRVEQQIGTETIQYVNDPVSNQALTETSAGVTHTDFFGLERISYRGGGSEKYFQYDGLGNVVSVTGSTGGLDTNYSYAPFGQDKASVAGVKNEYQFAGDAVDPGTGFIYMNGNYYRPAWGRFFSGGTLAGSPNPYPYLGSNPLP